MGQAKQRKAEIEQLKAQKTKVSFVAIRHTEDGEKEFFMAEVDLGAKSPLSKNDLLAYICLKDWLHTPPAQVVAEYLIQTKTYEMCNGMMPDAGYVINFYEVDEEISARKGQKSFSCREIMVSDLAGIKEYAEKMADELRATGRYSVKTHVA